MTTPQHLEIEVPSPYTRMKVGRQALSVGHDGFSVLTDGHVWLTALAGSTFSAHSQGPLRVVSKENNVYVAAKVGVTAATTGGATIAATGGVKIIAGYDSQPSYQAPNQTIGAPPSADDVSGGCDDVATAWTIADTTVAALLTVKGMGLMALGNRHNKPREMLTSANAIAAMGVASGIAAVGTNAAGMSGMSAPGINVHAEGGINIATPAFCSFHGMAGALLCSPFNTQVFGAATVGVAGLASAGMSSLGKVDLASSRGVSAIGGLTCDVKSSFGEVILKAGKGVSIGQVLPDPGTSAQVVTATLDLEAKVGVRLTSAKGEVRLGRVPADIPVESQVQTGIAGMIAVAALGLGAAPIRTVQPPPTDPTLTLAQTIEAGTESAFVATESITLAVGPWIVSIDKKGVTLGMGAVPPPASADGKIAAPTITGSQVKMEKACLTAAAKPAGGEMKLRARTAIVGSTTGPGTIELSSSAVKINGFSMVTFA